MDEKVEKTESVFRKSALNRISSPEELDRYLVVTGPGIWMTLAAIIVLLIGAFSWMIFGKLDTTAQVAVVSSGEQTLCLVPTEQLDAFLERGTVTVADKEYTFTDTGLAEQFITSETDVNIRLAGMLSEGVLVTPLTVETTLPEGVYQGQVVVETVNPITYIIN